jgi:hypothetical protein
MLQPMHFADEGATLYPVVTDFFRTFNEEMYSLYLLSFLLTADHDKAQQCLVSAVGECVEGIGGPVDWARSWARGAVVKRAIQMIMPAPEHADRLSTLTLMKSATAEENNPFAAILLLDAFERFVFVMSILEGRSEEECAILLRCSRRDVMMARALTLAPHSSPDAPAEEILRDHLS